MPAIRKSRTDEGLTEAEQTEQATLRKAYVEAMRQSLRGHLDNTVVIYPDGSRKPLSQAGKQKK